MSENRSMLVSVGEGPPAMLRLRTFDALPKSFHVRAAHQILSQLSVCKWRIPRRLRKAMRLRGRATQRYAFELLAILQT